MKLLIKIDELINYKSRDLIPLECEICKSTFYKSKNIIQRGIKGTRKVNVCSKKCHTMLIGTFNKIYNKKYPDFINIKCECCSKEFSRTYRIYARQIKNNKKQYCSKSCSSTAQRLNQNNRSTIELWLEENLKNKYPTLDLFFNVRDIIEKNELDIYIPSLKLAFEINGAYHYIPIYGEDDLLKRKQKDCFKLQQCKDRNINLHTIDVRDYKSIKKSKNILLKTLQEIEYKIKNGSGTGT